MNRTPYDLIAVGEVLIDLISEQVAPALDQAVKFRRFLGGQVANVAWNVSLLGLRGQPWVWPRYLAPQAA